MTDPTSSRRAGSVTEQLSLLSSDPAVPDADTIARARVAESLEQTLFVEAGAGSGKTRALVDRVESLVMAGEPIESIAAITFTERAAAELRDRIRHRLESAVADGHDSHDRAGTALRQLDAAAVGTLHSFAQRILGEHPVEAGLPPGVEVLDEIGSGIEFDERWHRFVDVVLENVSLGRSLLVLESARVTLEHLRTLTLVIAENWDLAQERLDLDPPEPEPFDPAPHIARFEAAIALRAHCINHDDKLLARLDELDDLVTELGSTDEIDALGMAGAIVARTKVGNVGAKRNWSLPVAEVRDAVTEARTQLEAHIAAMAHAALTHMVGALARFTLEAAEDRRRTGRLEFHDLLVRARRLLRHPTHGPDVRSELRARYRRLLLDEFQDTDPIQVELALLLASDPAHDPESLDWADLSPDPGRLFFVGDPKQSIYRFRRADMAVFLRTRDLIADRPALTRNFRTTAAVIEWVNAVFSRLIVATEFAQPEYVALDAQRRTPPPVGPAVAVLGDEPVAASTDAETLRHIESDAVARCVASALHEGWSVDDGTPDDPRWRPARAGDICILLPSRTSLASLERALERAGIRYRAETSSLVYATREIRDVLIAMRAIADPTDELATVAALRSPLYACGDDDLAHWRVELGGRFSLWSEPPDGDHGDHPVADGLAHLGALHEARTWSSPAELLDRLITERAVYESAIAGGRPRDVWRRLRFVVDQARAWADAGGTDLRAYLEWANLQGAENARVAETVLPETDDDSVRILTVHASKGLEFPIVVMAGMTTQLRGPNAGPVLAFPPDDEPVIRVRTGVATPSFERWQPIDEQMDHAERIRLLYVAATRARDHLVVSLVRADGGKATAARLLAEAGALDSPATAIDPPRLAVAPAATSPAGSLPERSAWASERTAALAAASRRNVVAATTLAREAAHADDPGLAKNARDLDLPPWNKGRYGTAIGRAVHGVLQVVDLATGDGLDDAATAQAAAEGVARHRETIVALARSALDSPVARQASSCRHWRELWVAAPIGDRLVEGYVDLLYEVDDGLVVVDWKTDHVDGDDDVAAKLARYRLQGAAYAAAVEVATGRQVLRTVFVFASPDGATEAEIDDLEGATAEVRALADTGGLDTLDELTDEIER